MRLALFSALVAIMAAPTAVWAADEPIEVSGAGEHRIAVIENPEIDGNTYAVTGTVSYVDVSDPGYLEMWSHFADGTSFFSRTLAAEGVQGVISGTSDDRPFSIPFFLGDTDAVPIRLEINVVLPGDGTVVVTDLALESPIGSAAGTGGWWSVRRGNIIGAILGILTGLAGAALGVLAGSGRAKRFVLTAPKIGIAWGGALALGGLVAIAMSQPRHVWYPLVLVGAVTALVSFSILPAIRRRHQQSELHRMHALDA